MTNHQTLSAERPPILVSACLLGIPCRYSGDAAPDAGVLALCERHTAIPVCPEQLGGLPTPRPPAERSGERVFDSAGTEVTDAFVRGAQFTLEIARISRCRIAVLKARSPSCGPGEIYDGTFSGMRTAGSGVVAQLLASNGIRVFSEENLGDLEAQMS